jgi:acid phosphatase (class A)
MASRACVALALLALSAGCATVDPPPTDLPEIRPGYVAGYLKPEELPDTLALLPPPPEDGSPLAAADLAHYRSLARLEGGERWKQASKDAELRFPAAAAFFSCALDMPISKEATPHLNMLLRRIRMDASRANDRPKEHYRRSRPYQVTREPSCEKSGRKPDSYPSGHASIGWAWALALAELAPDRADRILARGYAYGESRAVCRMHWRSDLEAGRTVGAATIARLHANPVFVAQMAEARREIAAARAAGARPAHDCAAEAKAFAEGR